MSEPKRDVVVIGAGPYGLSMAAHLAVAGSDVAVLGRPMDFWSRCMPAGMWLRSSWDASHIASPGSNYSLDCYQRELSGSISRPIPLQTFVEYGLWFRDHLPAQIDGRLAASVQRSASGFRITTEDGDSLSCSRVVIAGGIEMFAWRPEPLSSLPPHLVSHAVDHSDLSHFRGKRLAVIGAGQSALESAAIAAEAGAEVEVLSRSTTIHWLQRSLKLHQQHGIVGRLLYPPTDVGPPVLNQIVARPHVFRVFPPALQSRIAYRSIRPAGAGWLVDRLSQTKITLGTPVTGVKTSPATATLFLGNGSRREVDHVLLATGYRIDIARYPFLDASMLASIDRRGGYPILGSGFEASVPNLHFVGAVSALSFGPVMRFVSGTNFSASELVKVVMGKRGERPTSRPVGQTGTEALASGSGSTWRA